jgi:hypothetical protein
MISILKEKALVIILFLFSLLINQYYGNRGIFPVDSFAHFDTGFRILLGEHPFKNYWIVSGPFLDYTQSIFFYLFGVNWQAYIFHASLINAILTLATFFILKNFNLNIRYSFAYAILFSIIAYPISGTPFVDLHSAFFSLLGIYSLILGIKNEKKIYWILFPIFFGFSFLSKQVPSSYVIISSIFVLIIFSIFCKKYYWIKYSFISSILLILLVLIFGKIQGISLFSFLEQYIFYPQSIGRERFSNFNITFSALVGHFKFIYIAIIPLFFTNIKKIFFEKNYFINKNFYYFLILFLFTFSLIFHQLITRNQTFIFFLIPILFGFSHINLSNYKINSKNLFSIIFISICLFAVLKYHIRFNENRKFHDLNYVDFNLSSEAKKIDKKLSGLKWITPEYKNNPQTEINLLNEIKLYLESDNRTKMVMTNYSFFSSILSEKLFSPTRWHIPDGTDYPLSGNKYFDSYKNLLIRLIEKNNIKVIYTIYPVKNSVIFTYLNKSCFKETKISSILSSYEIKNCYEINS